MINLPPRGGSGVEWDGDTCIALDGDSPTGYQGLVVGKRHDFASAQTRSAASAGGKRNGRERKSAIAIYSFSTPTICWIFTNSAKPAYPGSNTST